MAPKHTTSSIINPFNHYKIAPLHVVVDSALDKESVLADLILAVVIVHAPIVVTVLTITKSLDANTGNHN